MSKTDFTRQHNTFSSSLFIAAGVDTSAQKQLAGRVKGYINTFKKKWKDAVVRKWQTKVSAGPLEIAQQIVDQRISTSSKYNLRIPTLMEIEYTCQVLKIKTEEYGKIKGRKWNQCSLTRSLIIWMTWVPTYQSQRSLTSLMLLQHPKENSHPLELIVLILRICKVLSKKEWKLMKVTQRRNS